jgi:hypothetical protein
MTRRQVLIGAGAAGVVASLAPTAALADDQGKGKLVRWDLVQIVEGVVLAGGTDTGLDSGSRLMVRLTGSGQAEPARRQAAGGGTFALLKLDGTELLHGVYFVTGFDAFRNAGGTLVGAGLTDGIGELEETTGGSLSLKVHLVATSGRRADFVLTVHCNLPGSSPEIEGITLVGGPRSFTQHGGATLFHVVRGDEH